MDFNKLKEVGSGFLSKGSESSNTTQQPAGDDTAAPAAGAAAPTENKQDYGDKAFGFLAKKSGQNVNADTSEKITDGARGLYEKATGSKVDSKYSN